MAEIRDNKPLWGIGEVLAISWPASTSMLNSTLMRFVDAVMVSLLGPAAMGAQFVAGISSFVPESFATGVTNAVNTYVSQNLGAKRFERCGQYAWAGLLLAMVFCVVILPLIFFADPIFRVLLKQPEQLLGLETMYFRYMIFAVLFTLTARPLEQFFYGIHRPRIVLAGSMGTQLLNLVLGFVLIFGRTGPAMLFEKFGWAKSAWSFLAWAHVDEPLAHAFETTVTFEGLGLRGAAIAAVISWAAYVGVLLAVFWFFKERDRFATRKARAVTKQDVKDLLKTGSPMGLQFLNDVLPWTLFTAIIIGQFGPVHIEASSAAMRWMPLSFMPAVGIGIATTALVGRYIGEGKLDIARHRAYAAFFTALVYMGICAMAFLIFRREMISLFVTIPGGAGEELAAHAEEIIRVGGYVMICAAIFQLSDAAGIVLIGALRGAGDTFWPMVYTIALSWGLNIFAAWGISYCFPQWGSVGPWAMATLYVIVLGVVVAMRFERGAWRKIDLLHRAEPAPAAPAAPPPVKDDPPGPPHGV